MNKTLKIIIIVVVVLVGINVLALIGGRALDHAIVENDAKVQEIADAYKAKDMEAFFKRLEDNRNFSCFFETLNSGSTEGMGAVYQRVYELTKDARITCEEKDSYTVEVTFKTVDASQGIIEALSEAALSGSEAFADMPAWLLKGLENPVEVEKTVEFDLRDSDSDGYGVNTNKEFFSALTAGAYEYLDYTMTVCTDETSTSCLCASGNAVEISVDYYYTPLDEEIYAEEDIQDYIEAVAADYEGEDGIAGGVIREEDGLTEYVVIFYENVSFYTLQKLGFISSANIDGISLKKTIEGFEEDGMTCETTDFNSGAMDK